MKPPVVRNVNLFIIYCQWGGGLWWFRWNFGKRTGWILKDINRNRLLFSERNGYRGRKIGHYFIRKLD